jgi:hypothetical protein
VDSVVITIAPYGHSKIQQDTAGHTETAGHTQRERAEGIGELEELEELTAGRRWAAPAYIPGVRWMLNSS